MCAAVFAGKWSLRKPEAAPLLLALLFQSFAQGFNNKNRNSSKIFVPCATSTYENQHPKKPRIFSADAQVQPIMEGDKITFCRADGGKWPSQTPSKS
jgi:hypothetical protein